ncbi:MAG: pyridoxamine 5'-phosphate oxidase family protein [Gemmatimonadota bacterium]
MKRTGARPTEADVDGADGSDGAGLGEHGSAAATPRWRFGSGELTAADVEAVLARNWWGTLATSVDGQPYGVPIVYGYDGEHFYVASAPGRKVDAVEANPSVTLTVVEVAPDASGWSSVIVFGSVEFVREPAGYLRALKALRGQRGYAGSVSPADAARMARARVLRITPSEITGRTKE